VLGLAPLLARLRGASAAAGLVWLSSGDEQWAAHLQQILQAQPATPVVLLSSAPEPQQGLSAINGGARGYTHAYAVPALLQEVALVVEHGGLWVGPELLQRLVGSTQAALAARRPAANPAQVAPSDKVWASLSAREAEVARAVSQGRSNKEVADLMHISERTVKAHLGAVFEKLGVRDRLQLVLRLATATDSAAPAPEKLP
jgi:DNA-binding NarL/FixJ family response regulator